MYCYILQEEQEEKAMLDKMDVQSLALIPQHGQDDGIYMLYQICIAPFSNNRSILFPPVAIDEVQEILDNLIGRKHKRIHTWYDATDQLPDVMGIHKHLVIYCSTIHLSFLDGGTCMMHQIYRLLFLDSTANRNYPFITH